MSLYEEMAALVAALDLWPDTHTGGGGVTVHDLLTGRSTADAHPTSAITGLDRKSELITLRVAGNEAAFHFALTITNGDHRMRIEPIDVMVFDGEGKIAGMKAYWSAENITQL